MKRVIFYAALCCALMACGGAKTNSESADSKTDASVSETPASAKTTFADFEKGDYKIYALRGKVSNVEYDYKSDGYTRQIAFGSDGHVTADDGEILDLGRNDFENQFVRDANDNIINIDLDEEGFGTSLTYNGKGLLHVYKHTTEESEYEEKFIYNDDCEIVSVSEEYTYYFDEGVGHNTTYNYTIQERDSHGNWTKAKLDKETKHDSGSTEKQSSEITRKITYFD